MNAAKYRSHGWRKGAVGPAHDSADSSRLFSHLNSIPRLSRYRKLLLPCIYALSHPIYRVSNPLSQNAHIALPSAWVIVVIAITRFELVARWRFFVSMLHVLARI